MNTYNGMSATELSGARWRKSSISNSQGACVELAKVGESEVAMRNSRNPDGPALIYTRAEIAALIEGVKLGVADRNRGLERHYFGIQWVGAGKAYIRSSRSHFADAAQFRVFSASAA